jgi:hypothetical protein
MLRILIFAVAALSVTACSFLTEPDGPGFDGVELLTDRNSYVHGDTIEIRFINNSTQRVGYGACSRSLERRTHEGWKPLDKHEGPCILILHVLDPGQVKIDRAPIDPALPAGEYRLHQSILPGTSLPVRSIFSPTWTIDGDE